jgi:CheY-like chemotaxis protein
MSTLRAILLTILPLIASAQSTSGSDHPSRSCHMADSCTFACVSTRDCTLPTDQRDCSRGVIIFGVPIGAGNDPICETTKAAQNRIYATQKAACETTKMREVLECEGRKSACLSVAKACSDVLDEARTAGTKGARILWVDDNPENNFYERQALTELGIEIVLAKNTQQALEKLQSQNGKFDTIISDFARSDDPQGGYTLLKEVLRLPHAPHYIIYSGSANPAFVADAKAKGAFGETDQAKELFDLVIKSVKKRP